jgi:hypothetical protein
MILIRLSAIRGLNGFCFFHKNTFVSWVLVLPGLTGTNAPYTHNVEVLCPGGTRAVLNALPTQEERACPPEPRLNSVLSMIWSCTGLVKSTKYAARPATLTTRSV